MNEEKLNRIAELSEEFVDDVMPQVGGLAIQRYDHLNELCLLLTEWRKSQDD